MKVGFFYQSAFNYVACYTALNQLRKWYPQSSVVLYEDRSDILKEVADKFNCVYKKTTIEGKSRSKFLGSPAHDRESTLDWLKRIYTECKTNLKDVDWIVHFEDDVWCMRKIQEEPKFMLQGAPGPPYKEALTKYLESRERKVEVGSMGSYGMAGGSIFNRQGFIECYDNLKDIDWDFIDTLDDRVLKWTDVVLTFVFQYSGYPYQKWNEFGRYNAKDTAFKTDKSGYSVPLSEQVNCTFLHPFKHFYNYEKEELQEALNKKL